MIGAKFPDVIESTKLSYNTSKKLHRFWTPKQCNSIVGGLVIELPTENLEERLAELIELEQVKPDEELVEYL